MNVIIDHNKLIEVTSFFHLGTAHKVIVHDIVKERNTSDHVQTSANKLSLGQVFN
jgi:hypothetical protein